MNINNLLSLALKEQYRKWYVNYEIWVKGAKIQKRIFLKIAVVYNTATPDS